MWMGDGRAEFEREGEEKSGYEVEIIGMLRW